MSTGISDEDQKILDQASEMNDESGEFIPTAPTSQSELQKPTYISPGALAERYNNIKDKKDPNDRSLWVDSKGAAGSVVRNQQFTDQRPRPAAENYPKDPQRNEKHIGDAISVEGYQKGSPSQQKEVTQNWQNRHNNRP